MELTNSLQRLYYIFIFQSIFFLQQCFPKKTVLVFHYVINYWGNSQEGVIDCSAMAPDLHCEWTHSDHLNTLRERLDQKRLTFDTTNDTITVGMYNVHSWWERMRKSHPANCELHVNLTMVESEESRVRYNSLFTPSFKHFDGVSTTSPTAAVQRVYHEAFLYELNMSKPLVPFSKLVKGGSYVASDCHRRDAANSNRDGVVHWLRLEGARIDGLGKCMKNKNHEGISLPQTPDARYNLEMKRDIIGKYLFYMAFENSIEPGYVTEKPFDALLAGTVPVYLGDHETLRILLPDAKAAIFIADYNNNYTALAAYLNYLTTNESAYEEHRAWRRDFSIVQHHNSKPLLRHPWECRICDWAIKAGSQQQYYKHHECHRNAHHHPIVAHHRNDSMSNSLRTANVTQYEGKVVKGLKRAMFFVQNGTLHAIPDYSTFMSLKVDPTKTIVLTNEDITHMPMGEPLAKVDSQ